jgi:hypothetical protein
MPTEEIDAHRESGAPDDFGGPWSWADIREASRIYRVDAVIDIVAIRSRDGVALRCSRIRPIQGGAIVPLEVTAARTLSAAVAALVERLATDTILLAPAARHRRD